MDSFEKLQRAIALEPTPEIPVHPHIVTFAGRFAGVTQAELFSSNKVWLDACDKTFAKVGAPDVVFPMNPWDTAYTEALRVKLPGRDLGPDVDTYCRELIDFMGHEGGFILGSGCEVPITAKVENVAALIAAVRR